ncbi:hypothetical protein WJX84_006112 [Apatococcus fuscideae]|uniref:J domain-containing protein n=1 Tax=Apatococcus fuscideae TaxID=2026836 RepID=A0AAW1SM19_9CHLO
MDFYALLGVSKSATQAEIKAAFRKKALKLHPDRQAEASADQAARIAKEFEAVKDAYDTLTNDTKRALYQRTGRSSSAAGTASSTDYAHAQNPYSGRYGYAYARPQAHRTGFVVGNFRAFMQGMTRADGFFHALMAGTIVGGVLLFNVFGDTIWEQWNHGKLYKHIEEQPPSQRPGRRFQSSSSSSNHQLHDLQLEVSH